MYWGALFLKIIGESGPKTYFIVLGLERFTSQKQGPWCPCNFFFFRSKKPPGVAKRARKKPETDTDGGHGHGRDDHDAPKLFREMPTFFTKRRSCRSFTIPGKGMGRGNQMRRFATRPRDICCHIFSCSSRLRDLK